jgi:hypothetical protein
LGDLADLGLLEVLVVLDDVEELTLAQLGHDDKLWARFEGVKQNDDVRVL